MKKKERFITPDPKGKVPSMQEEKHISVILLWCEQQYIKVY